MLPKLLLAAFLFFITQPGICARDFVGFRAFDEQEISGKFWSFCGREEIPSLKGSVDVSGNVCSETFSGRTDFFVSSADLVFWTGYNVGRYKGVIIDKPVPVAYLPGFSAPGHAVPYTGSGRENVATEFSEAGTYCINVLAVGCASIVPGDTIRDVVLTRQTVTSRFSASDSVPSEPETRTIFRWHVKGSLLPIAVQTDEGLFIDRSAPEYEQDKDIVSSSVSEVRQVIDAATINVENGILTVLLDAGVKIDIYIMDVAGNIYRHTSGDEVSYSIDVSELPHGQYIVSVIALTGNYYTRKNILNL